MSRRRQSDGVVRTRTRAGSRDERGSGLLEQALTLSVLLAVLFGIINFGQALYTYHFVSSSAREATRWASVRGSASNLPQRMATNGDIQTQFFTNVSGIGLDASKITANTAWLAGPNGHPTNAQCAGKLPGCVVRVQVSYQYSFLLPFLPTAPINMSSTSEMVITQ